MTSIQMSAMTALTRVLDMNDRDSSISYEDAIRIAEKSSTDGAAHDYIRAREILNMQIHFSDISDRRIIIQDVLKALIIENSYPWKRVIKYGRSHLVNQLTENEKQVFEAADLLIENPNKEIVEWWSELESLTSKTQENWGFRDWENRSLQKEIKILESENCPHQPVWVALNDNFLGYDIISYRKIDNDWIPFYIEVKSTDSGLSKFLISDREIQTLIQSPDCYQIDFWQASNSNLTEILGTQMLQHIPTNNGNGRWKTLEIVW